jgi:hypothetical protein
MGALGRVLIRRLFPGPRLSRSVKMEVYIII